jgi:hypothetical protein
MTHYRLILTTDCQKTDLTSRQVTALARTSSYSKLQTRPLVREDLTPRRTGRLTVGRNVTLTLT